MTAHLDSKAAKKLADDLAAIPALFADLPAVKTGIHDPSNNTRKPPESKPPLSMEVVSLLDTEKKGVEEYDQMDPRGRRKVIVDEDDQPALKPVLNRYGVVPRVGLWLRMAVEEMTEAGETVPPIDTWMNLDQLCHSLQQVTAWVITQQWSTELAQDLAALRAEIEQALGIAKVFEPKCRNYWCGAKLEAMDKGSWYRCPSCEREYVVSADLKALGAAQYLRGEEVAQLLDISWSTVRRFKAEGWIRPAAYTSEGVALFDLDQVRAVRDTPTEDRKACK